MADIFLSYRNTPERRAYVERLKLALDPYGITAWWDYGLEAGKTFEPQIMAELEDAGLVCPLWCEESIRSEWVLKEAAIGQKSGKLLPLMLQPVNPPRPYDDIQAHDLVGWQGGAEEYYVATLSNLISRRLKALGDWNHKGSSDPGVLASWIQASNLFPALKKAAAEKYREKTEGDLRKNASDLLAQPYEIVEKQILHTDRAKPTPKVTDFQGLPASAVSWMTEFESLVSQICKLGGVNEKQNLFREIKEPPRSGAVPATARR